MSLGKDYCKEIAKELRQIPVYIPGTAVSAGDIIAFDDTTIFGKPKPLGTFKKIGSLSDFQIDIDTETEENNELDSYVFASKGSVNVGFQADVNAAEVGKGTLSINFNKEGATYLSAVDCKETRLKSIVNLEDSLKKHQHKIEWKNYFIVVSVTVASKAIIMQSNTSSASLEIKGNIQNLQPSSVIDRDLSADIELKISSYKEASFIKDWSSNVPVFFKLVRYKKRFLGEWDVITRKSRQVVFMGDSITQELDVSSDIADKKPDYILDEVDASELVDF